MYKTKTAMAMKIGYFALFILLSSFLLTVLGIENVENINMTALFWVDIQMPKINHFAGFGFTAPTDETIWTKAKDYAISRNQVLLKQVLNVIHNPGEVIHGGYRRIKKLIDVHLYEEVGFEPMKSFNGKRAPICIMGGTPEANNRLFPIQNVVDYIKKEKSKSDKEIPSSGFIGVGSFNENWGWLSTHFLNRTTSWALFGLGPNKDSRKVPRNGLND